ncbi:MAG: Trk system potassium transporter TrkA [SAR324 cluster bacterium]|nr:Trk system potassium transporter TrkA [SAR324 cluster bacterium]
MKIAIAGAGEVGYHLIESLYRDYPQIAVIDTDHETLQKLEKSFGIKVYHGNIIDSPLLAKNGLADFDLFLAITNSDETNMISCRMAKDAGVNTTICRIRQIELEGTKRETTLEALGIDIVINPVILTARELARFVEYPNVVEQIDFFEKAVELRGYKVRDYCSYLNRTCDELFNELNKNSVWLSFILRNERSIVPTKETEIFEGDHIYFLTPRTKIDWLRANLGYTSDKQTKKRIMINGGGHVGYQLAKKLEKTQFFVKVIELNKERAFRIAEQLENSMVLNFDGTDKNALLAEGIEDTDIFLSLTEKEELNITACALAGKLGAKTTMALLKQPELVRIIEQSAPIDKALSPRIITARYLSRYIKGSGLGSYYSINNLEIIEVVVDTTTACYNKEIKNLECPEDVRVAMVERGGEVFLAHSATKLKKDDRIILVLHNWEKEYATKMFNLKEMGS